MDFHKYNQLRDKINRKDFEGSFKILDAWLYIFSFIGNIGSIFFSYFLVYPSLYKAISINMTKSVWAVILSISFTVIFLIIFEIIKRYIVSSFSFNFVSSKKKIKPNNLSWLVISVLILFLSFYLSLVGSRDLATTREYKEEMIENDITIVIDSLTTISNENKKIYVEDNIKLRDVNISLRDKLMNTRVGYVTVRNEYQGNIDKNLEIINSNELKIKEIDDKLNAKILELKAEAEKDIVISENEDIKNITLFIIIAIFCEVIIFAGIYFREYFEANTFELNKEKYEKIYLRKDRYRALLAYIYNGGLLEVGTQVMPVMKLKELVADKTKIQNSNKFVDDFFLDMDRLGVFVLNGKRRNIGMSYENALQTIIDFDDTLRYIENIK